MEVWLTLKKIYAFVSESHVMQLNTALNNIQKGSESIDKYLLRIKSLRDRLAVAGVDMDDKDVKFVILAGPPSEYGHTRQIIRSKSNVDLEEVRSLLLSAEYEIELKYKSAPLALLAAMIAQNGMFHNSQQNSQYGMNSGLNSSPDLVQPIISPGYVTYNRCPLSYGLLPTVNDGVMVNNSSGISHPGVTQSKGSRNSCTGHYSGNYAGNNSAFSDDNCDSYSVDIGSSMSNGKSTCSNPVICQICAKPGHSAWKCQQRNTQPTQNRASTSTVSCHLCYNCGHTAQVCSKCSSPRQLCASGSSMKCQICFELGHSAIECLHRHHYGTTSPTCAATVALSASQSKVNVNACSDEGSEETKPSNLNEYAANHMETNTSGVGALNELGHVPPTTTVIQSQHGGSSSNVECQAQAVNQAMLKETDSMLIQGTLPLPCPPQRPILSTVGRFVDLGSKASHLSSSLRVEHILSCNLKLGPLPSA